MNRYLEHNWIDDVCTTCGLKREKAGYGRVVFYTTISGATSFKGKVPVCHKIERVEQINEIDVLFKEIEKLNKRIAFYEDKIGQLMKIRSPLFKQLDKLSLEKGKETMQ